MSQKFSEVLAEHECKDFAELSAKLPPNALKIIERIYENDIRYGEDIMNKYREQQKIDDINRRNAEMFKREKALADEQHEREICTAIETATTVSRSLRGELNTLSSKYRSELITIPGVDFDVNKKLVNTIIRQYADGDDYSSDDFGKIIRSAIGVFEYMQELEERQ